MNKKEKIDKLNEVWKDLVKLNKKISRRADQINEIAEDLKEIGEEVEPLQNYHRDGLIPNTVVTICGAIAGGLIASYLSSEQELNSSDLVCEIPIEDDILKEHTGNTDVQGEVVI